MLLPKSDVGSPPFPGKHAENRAVNTVTPCPIRAQNRLMNWWTELTCAALLRLLEGLWDSGAQGFFGFNSRQLHR